MGPLSIYSAIWCGFGVVAMALYGVVIIIIKKSIYIAP